MTLTPHRKLLRTLTMQAGLGIGSQILLTGDWSLTWCEELWALGIDTTWMTSEVPESLPPSHRFGDAVVSWSKVDWLRDHLCYFDAIIDHCGQSFQQNLFASTSRKRLATLLSTLRPGGQFVGMFDHEPFGTTACHTPDCWSKLLGGLKGTLTNTRLPQGYLNPGSWKSILKGVPRPAQIMTAFQTPNALRSEREWLTELDQFAEADHLCCSLCEPGMTTQRVDSKTTRKAA